jgi:hypothetical protein
MFITLAQKNNQKLKNKYFLEFFAINAACFDHRSIQREREREIKVQRNSMHTVVTHRALTRDLSEKKSTRENEKKELGIF